MTRQIKGSPDPMVLKSDYPGESFPGLKLYRVLDPLFQAYLWKDFPAVETAKLPARVSCDWGSKGYTEHLRLRADGRLVLEGYEYDLCFSRVVKNLPAHEMTSIHQVFEGNFYLDLRASFRSRSWLAPFHSGVFVADRKKWHRKINWELFIPKPFG